MNVCFTEFFYLDKCLFRGMAINLVCFTLIQYEFSHYDKNVLFHTWTLVSSIVTMDNMSMSVHITGAWMSNVSNVAA